MRIALVIYGSLETVSGGYLYDRMLVSKLRHRGNTVDIISMPRRPYAASLLDNVGTPVEGGFDLILQDELNHPSLFLANRRPRVSPIISIVHHLRSSERRPEWQNAIYRAVERRYLRLVDGFVFNSETTRASVELLLAVKKPHVVAVPGGDRLGRVAAAEVRRRAHESGPLRVIFVGSLTAAKGLDLLLEAVSMVDRDQLKLDVVGPRVDPAFAGRMERRVAELRLPVRFRGELDDAALSERLRAGHVLVVPSFYEGFGIVYLEAMAQGLPAIGTTAGAVPELITDGVDGFLVKPGDAATLAQRIRNLGRDRELLVRMGLAALRRFEAAPTWDQTTEKIWDFVRTVAGKRA
ncbi:MAG TPA: glycosyltransferase family 4 protein [Anaerolineales bacterium]